MCRAGTLSVASCNKAGWNWGPDPQQNVCCNELVFARVLISLSHDTLAFIAPTEGFERQDCFVHRSASKPQSYCGQRDPVEMYHLQMCECYTRAHTCNRTHGVRRYKEIRP